MELTPQQKIIARCKEMVAKAKELYNLDLEKVKVDFNLKGRAAGKAGGRRYRGEGGEYYIKLNRDMLGREAFEHLLNNTIPHEYAHVVCFMNPNLGKNHDAGWQRVCTALGGTGARTHSEEVVYGKGNTYEYTTSNGNKVRVGDKYHRMVQSGRTLRFKKGKGEISMTCAYSIVGMQGRTLANPIVKNAGTQVATVPAPAPVQRPVVQTPAPVQTRMPVPAQTLPGESKAATSRRIMLSGYRAGHSYEAIISAMMLANGYDRQLARATFKANAAKVGIPETFY